MEAGLFVILVGIIFLLNSLGLLANIDWNIIWPLVIIVIGLMMVLGKSNRHRGVFCIGKKCDHCDHRG